jgi:ferredoxin
MEREKTPTRQASQGEDWRDFFAVGELDAPPYKPDIVGPMVRFDERDCVFARRDLRPGTPEYETYYARFPERLAFDDSVRAIARPGSGHDTPNHEMVDAVFGSVILLGTPTAVEGMLAAPAAAACGGLPPTALLPAAEASRKVKGFARALGADLVGIGPLQEEFRYSHIGRTFYGQRWGKEIDLNHPHAISLGIKMNGAGLVRTAPAYPTMLESGIAYAKAALISVQLAAYIRALGFRARAHHLRDYQLLSVPVAVDAGLGEMGRCGFLITREFGNCIRLATVSTDLPLLFDKPVDIGVEAFCQRCTACARECPAQAIPLGGKEEVRGVRKWTVDAERCYKYWHEVGSDCALCIVSCPWSRWTLGPKPEDTVDPVPGYHIRPARIPDWLGGD